MLSIANYIQNLITQENLGLLILYEMLLKTKISYTT